MATAAFIDLILSPIAGGIGATIGISMVIKKQPEKFEQFSGWGVRLLVGASVALLLLGWKMF